MAGVAFKSAAARCVVDAVASAARHAVLFFDIVRCARLVVSKARSDLGSPRNEMAWAHTSSLRRRRGAAVSWDMMIAAGGF